MARNSIDHLRLRYRVLSFIARALRFLIGFLILAFLFGVPVILMLVPLPIRMSDIDHALYVWFTYMSTLTGIEVLRRLAVHASYMTHLKIEEYEDDEDSDT